MPSAQSYTLAAYDIGTAGATLSGQYSAATTAPSEVGFEFGTSPSLGQKVTASTTSGTSGYFTKTISGLNQNTTYYARAYVVVNGTEDYASQSQSFFGETIEFTTLGAEPALARNWAELPAARTLANYEVAAHESLPSNSKLRNYSFGFDKAKHCALWVAYPLHSCYLGSTSRTDAFDYDPYCIDNSYEAYISKNAYYPQGSDTYSHSRGHQLPSADRTVSVEDNYTTFYATNMTPQLQALNGGAWMNLEDDIRKNMICSDTLYVVTGAHFDGSQGYAYDSKGTGKACAVPTHYYKVLLRTKSGNSGKRVQECSTSELQCIGYWVEHSGSATVQTKSVAEIEALTGFTFFTNVPNAPKSSKEWSY